mgnify:CR=1 FL=1
MGLNITAFPARASVEIEIEERGKKRTLYGNFDLPTLEWFKNAFIILFDAQNSGTTAQRPTQNLYVGKTYFDTTLGIPIWYSGAIWVKSDGTAA